MCEHVLGKQLNPLRDPNFIRGCSAEADYNVWQFPMQQNYYFGEFPLYLFDAEFCKRQSVEKHNKCRPAFRTVTQEFCNHGKKKET